MAHRPTGVNTGSIEQSPRRRKRQEKRRRAEEAAWAARNGPVVTRRVDPAELQGGDGEPPAPARDSTPG